MERNALPAFLTLVGITALSALVGCLPEAGDATDPGFEDDVQDTVGDDGDGLIDDGTGDDGTGDDGTGGDDTAAAKQPIRFVALGDAGTGDETQYQVARAVEQVCSQNPCDFALFLGDNFYSDGVASVDDAQWLEKFEQPYANLDFLFWSALGNHDYGAGGGGFEIERAASQVEYTSRSEKWRMPDEYYVHAEGDATFIGLDTTALDWGRGQDQWDWIQGALDGASTSWKIAFGHHPYKSNGPHGNANENFGPFVDQNLCGRVDVYFSGHDHSLQWLEPTCGTEFIVSGAAAKLTEVGHGNHPSLYETETNGFMWVEIDGDQFTGVFYDLDGNELYRRSFTKTLQ